MGMVMWGSTSESWGDYTHTRGQSEPYLRDRFSELFKRTRVRRTFQRVDDNGLLGDDREVRIVLRLKAGDELP